MESQDAQGGRCTAMRQTKTLGGDVEVGRHKGFAPKSMFRLCSDRRRKALGIQRTDTLMD